jgi:hypothetical protein
VFLKYPHFKCLLYSAVPFSKFRFILYCKTFSIKGLHTLCVGKHIILFVEVQCPLGSGQDSDPTGSTCALYKLTDI